MIVIIYVQTSSENQSNSMWILCSNTYLLNINPYHLAIYVKEKNSLDISLVVSIWPSWFQYVLSVTIFPLIMRSGYFKCRFLILSTLFTLLAFSLKLSCLSHVLISPLPPIEPHIFCLHWQLHLSENYPALTAVQENRY